MYPDGGQYLGRHRAAATNLVPSAQRVTPRAFKAASKWSRVIFRKSCRQGRIHQGCLLRRLPEVARRFLG